MPDEPRPPSCPTCPPDTGGADADAVVGVRLSSDRMKLTVDCFTPHRGRGRSIDGNLLRQAMRRAEVVVEPDEDALQQVVELLRAGKNASRVSLATGRAPSAPCDAVLKPLLDLTRPVFPGMVFAHLQPAREARPGSDLLGKEIPAPPSAPPRDITVLHGGGCRNDGSGQLTAKVHGMVLMEEGQLRVAPLFVVSADKLTVTGTIHPQDAAGEIITVSRIAEELERMGVVFGVDRGMIHVMQDKAQAGGAPVAEVLMAEGQAPKHGEDARLEPLYTERNALGLVDEQGRMDYRDRGLSPVVEEGQDIARLHPATEGEPGKDVFGHTISARKGKALEPQLGKGVEAVEEGAVLRATIPGMVIRKRNLFEISDVLVIPGNVDLTSGNIRVSKGSVHIRGGIGSGFLVESPESVLVEGAVEDAVVRCGADLFVRGGIAMSGGETAGINAGGSVRALFAQNASIQAEGDVVIGRYIAHSDVKAGFQVRAGGHVRVTSATGRIMGGVVVAGRGIEVNEAGSVMGVPTVLVLARDVPEAQPLVDEKRLLKRRIEHIDLTLSRLTPERLAAFPEHKKAVVAVAIARRESLQARLLEVGQALAALAQTLMDTMDTSRIVVRGTAHPGVVIKMGGTAMHLSEPLKGRSFGWDRESKSIKVYPK